MSYDTMQSNTYFTAIQSIIPPALQETSPNFVSWPCILVWLWINDQPDAQLHYTYVSHYNPQHASSKSVLIIRRSNCINTASGTVFSVSDHPVCRLRWNQFLLNLHTGWSLTENTIPDAVLIQSDLLMMSTELLETYRGL